MSGETYYYFLSIALVLSVLLHIINALFFRVRGKTIFGQKYRSGTADHQRLSKFSSTRNLMIACAIASLLIVNLGYEMYKIGNIGTASSNFLLVSAPAASVLLFVVLAFVMRNWLGDANKSGRD